MAGRARPVTGAFLALASGDAALALGAPAGSLIASATLGPLLIGLLAADAASTDTGALLGRFALVVLIPLAAGVTSAPGRGATFTATIPAVFVPGDEDVEVVAEG
jgi:predicted Na+-dependent transporter